MHVSLPEFEEIYKANFDKLLKVAYRITGTIHDAEDVLQEAYINAFKSISQFNQKSSISTWLYKITLNCSLKYIKKRQTFPVSYMAREQGITENEFFEKLKSIEPVEDEVLYNDMRETCIQMFIECLPKKQRVSFVLKVIMGLPAYEVSKILDTSESAVKTNVFRARKAIKMHIEGKCSLINPKAPCQCALWVNYAVKTGKKGSIPQLNSSNRSFNDLSKKISGEINFLNKVAILYDNKIQSLSSSQFISAMRKIISGNTSSSFKIFS